jgi:hypothetical protein
MSTFEIIIDGLIFSKHDTHEDARLELVKVRNETLIEIENLRSELDEKQEFIKSLSIIERK